MDAQSDPQQNGGQKGSSRWIVMTALLVLASVGFLFLPVSAWVDKLQSYMDALGWAGPVVFIVVYAVLTVLLVPGTALTIASGVFFGLFYGTLYAVIGSNIGAFAAFMLARTSMRRRVEAWARDNPRFDAIDAALSRSGFKVVLLLRLSPVFPFCLLNYLLGLTRVPAIHYALAGVLGMFPGTLLFVYIGSLSASLAGAAASETPEVRRLKMAMRIVGFLATIVVTWLVGRMAGKALKAENQTTALAPQDAAS